MRGQALDALSWTLCCLKEFGLRCLLPRPGRRPTQPNLSAPATRERRAHYGARWRRAPSEQLTKSMRDKLNGYRGNLMQVSGGQAFSAAARQQQPTCLLLPLQPGPETEHQPYRRPHTRTPPPPLATALPTVQAGESDKRLEGKLAAEAAAFAALDPQAAATQMPKMQVGGAGVRVGSLGGAGSRAWRACFFSACSRDALQCGAAQLASPTHPHCLTPPHRPPC